ncbi:MAG: histidine kinase [Roseateles depolymerans]|uniref:histidine kinase n=1 Tax=Roseateles depolymerans TaxID=76731 RepID=A0A2W5DEZ9_9BURK|nr:MAG: histidine kinase [Roseateles depolymerans]
MRQALTARSASRYLALSAGIVAAYYLLGRLGLLLVLPPYQIAPIYPAAGWALAMLLTLGPAYVPAVMLGSFAVQWTTLAQIGQHSPLLAAAIALGAGLQAWLGHGLLKAWCGQPLLLTTPRHIASFLAATALAGTVSPSCATLALWQAQVIDAGQLNLVWLIWWIGDLVGVLIATPIALSLIGRPGPAWAARRLSVGVPMLLTTALVGIGVTVTLDWEHARQRSEFNRLADRAIQDLAAALKEPVLALEGLHGVLRVKPEPTRDEFDRATADLLDDDSALLALGYAKKVARQDLPAFNAAAAAEGLRGYQARDRIQAGDVSPPAGEDMLAIRLIEPLSRNVSALGVNIRSVGPSRAALTRAMESGRPTATAGLQLTQDREATIGVVLYLMLQDEAKGKTRPPLDRAIFATIRPDLLMARLAARWPEQLGTCLVDLDGDDGARRLGGPPGCETVQRDADAPLPMKSQALSFGGRHWEMRVYDLPGTPLATSHSWVFALVGLLATALVGALLLLLSGRTLHIEALVRERTAALEREIANRTRGESALAQSEQRLRSIFETAPTGIVFTDMQGLFKEVNPQYCSMLGYSAEELYRLSTVDITHPDDRAEDEALSLRLLRGEIPFYRRHKRYLARNGSVVQARTIVSVLRGGDGRPHRLVAVVEDITDQLRIEELNRAREAAEAANQAKNEFLSRMSHELRTPMNAILGFTQLMELDESAPLAPAQRSRAQQIAQAGWHLLEMINDTLDLSRIESGSLRLEPREIELPPLLARALAWVQTQAAERGLTLSQRVEADAARVTGDPTRVTQILSNLLSNAVKYNRPGGSVDVLAEQRGGWVEVRVRDSGIGLSDAQIDALFQPFNRLGREVSGLPGTGIGLVISQRLAQMMGGSLHAEPQTDGACFVLRLPAATTLAQPRSPVSDEPAAPPIASAQQLLYVEDNALNAEVMRGVLAQRPGLALTVEPTMEAGLRALQLHPPALLLLDLQLPDGDGLEFLRRARAENGDLPPVIMVSANAQPEQIDAARAAGVAHYLTKPLDVRALLALVDELLAAGHAGAGAK